MELYGSTRTWDKWTEARTAPVPCTPAMARDHTPSRELATTLRAGPHEDSLTASSGRPPRKGDGTRSRGLISPSRRLFSTAPAGGLIPLVPTRDIGVHISSPLCRKQDLPSALGLRAKRPPEDTRWRPSRASAPHKKSRPAAR